MPTTPRLRLLTFTTLFPHAGAPNHGVFVENRLRHLVASGAATATVVAPVPFFPSHAAIFGAWARHAAAPRRETRHGLDVHHPRYPVIPRIGMTLAPSLLYRACLPVLRRLLAEARARGEPFDAIDAHYLYPDGVAAVRLGRALGLPVVITARGSDVTQIPDHPRPRRMIQAAIAGAAALITVSAALRDGLIALGAPAEKVTVLRNGVDTSIFRPGDRTAQRAALGLDGPTLLSVGHLIARKGHDRIIAAMAGLPDVRLLIAGEGPERARLEALIAQHGLAARVRLLGARPHADLPAIYGAADALVLASSREGWANVLLEAMACGTPVLASDIPGNPEVVREPAAGRLFTPNEPAAIAAVVRALLAAPPDRAATRAYAERFGWAETTAGQLAVFRDVLAHRLTSPLSAPA